MTYQERRMAQDNIRCHVEEKADIRFQDGALRHVTGACSYQVVRAAKNLAVSPEGRGFTYNHAAMLTYFHGRFVIEYLGGPSGEHEFPSAALVVWSQDGIHWEKPVEAFPAVNVSSKPYRGPKREMLTADRVNCIVHHRMGFYTAKNGCLLMSSFYGISPDSHLAPNNGYGVGRVVREIYADFTMSKIYFLRYNVAGGYTRDHVDLFDDYKNSQDAKFVEACEEMLHDRLVTQQWWEEERLDTDFFTCCGGRALSYYTLPTGRVMGVFKDALTCYSDDGGEHWTPLKQSTSLETSSGKVWGQKTVDGRYALAYNPSPDSAHRWPLAVMSGKNGVDFYELAAILPEIAPSRYEGKLKNLGAQYMRGITEANQQPDDRAMWLTYSVNKEDIWISRIPLPIQSTENRDVQEKMCDMTEEELRNHWNLYVPAWNGAKLQDNRAGEMGLQLTDCDPYNRTRAERNFRPGVVVKLCTTMQIEALPQDEIALLLQDGHGKTVTCVIFCPDFWIYQYHGGLRTKLCSYELGQKIQISIQADVIENRVYLEAQCGEAQGSRRDSTGASVDRLERVVFTSKYDLPFQGLEENGKFGNLGNLPNADERCAETQFFIMELHVETIEE